MNLVRGRDFEMSTGDWISEIILMIRVINLNFPKFICESSFNIFLWIVYCVNEIQTPVPLSIYFLLLSILRFKWVIEKNPFFLRFKLRCALSHKYVTGNING